MTGPPEDSVEGVLRGCDGQVEKESELHIYSISSLDIDAVGEGELLEAVSWSVFLSEGQ